MDCPGKKVKLGIAATRRYVFSREDAIKYKKLLLEKVKSLNIEFVDLDWLNEDGLLFDAADVDKVVQKFKAEASMRYLSLTAILGLKKLW
jgi:hypothetical protein